MAQLSLSTWSLHRLLSPARVIAGDNAGSGEGVVQASLTLLDVPRELARRGMDAVEICHFHFPDTDGPYLESLRAALNDAGVEFFSLLIDTGDISSADAAKREHDIRLTEEWIDVAARTGAGRVRVSAGESPADDLAALDRAVAGLRRLASYGEARDVRVLTENWKPLASTPKNVKYLVEQLGGAVGLLADFGNFPKATKYDDLAEILPLAEDTHAKAEELGGGAIDEDDYARCLELCLESGYEGPFTVVYAGEQPWHGIEAAQNVIDRFLS